MAALGPGTCYSFCQTDYFGISNASCSCLEQRPTRIERQLVCSWSCSKKQCFPYGHIGSTAIYHYVSLKRSSQINDRNCQVYNITTASYRWATCSTPRRGLCTNGTLIHVTKEAWNWQAYPELCSDKQLLPLVQERIVTPITLPDDVDAGKLWIGTIKDLTIIETTIWSNESSTGLSGFINRSKTTFELVFHTTADRPVIKTLCFEPTAPGAKLEQTEGGRPSPDLVVLLVLCPVIGVAIVAAVITCLMLKKRKKAIYVTAYHESSPGTLRLNHYSNTIPRNSNYAECLRDSATNGGNVVIPIVFVCKSEKQPGTAVPSCRSDFKANKMEDATTECEYDTALEVGATRKETNIDDSDYSRLCEVVDDTYDEVMDVSQEQKVTNRRPDNVYDHIAPPAKGKTCSGIYDHVSSLKDAAKERSRVDETGNVYEHVMIPTGKQTKK